MFSQTALKIYALKKERIVKSNAHFWREFNDIDKIDAIEIDVHKFNKELTNNGVSLVCEKAIVLCLQIQIIMLLLWAF